MNPCQSSACPTESNTGNERDDLMDTSAHTEGINENIPEASLSGHDDTPIDDEHQSKHSKLDEPSPVPHALPGLQLRVRAPSDFNNRPEIVNSSASFSARKLNKKSLNIIIPPPLCAQKLGPSSAGPKGEEDPVTPLMQIIHTPTTAPGAPGPGDPVEQRRSGACWAVAALNGRRDQLDQLSPVFNPIGPGPCALEMCRLTAEATTPTFPPESSSLDLGFARTHRSHRSHRRDESLD